MAPLRRGGAFRGRGSARGRFRGGSGRNGFVKGRVHEVDEDHDSEEPEEVQTSQTESESDESSSDEEVAHVPVSQSYNALLKSFNHHSNEDELRVKRRKLHHDRQDEEDQLIQNQSVVQDDGPSEADNVDAADQASDAEEEQDEEGYDSDEEDAADPFDAHLANTDEANLKGRIKLVEDGKWVVTRNHLGTLGQRTVSMLQGEPAIFPKRKIIAVKDLQYIKRKLQDPAQSTIGVFDDVQQAIAPDVFDYRDILFGARNANNAGKLRTLTCLHALNHVFKTRDRVLKNNTRLSKDDQADEIEARDQGFTRPRVLFLLETRQNCVKYIDSMVSLCAPEQEENKKRFYDSYSSSDQHPEDMPEDFRELFDGNDDNEFRLGVKFTRKTMKLFSQFYASDVIFASPLGLRLAIEGKGPKKRDSDFLSSIELVIMDQADAMLMQNWDHVEYVFEHLNLQPKESHGCDFSRVRHWYLDGHAKYFRQTIVLSSYLTPVLLSLFSKQMRNIAGRVKYQPAYPGAIENLNVSLRIKQTFSRFHSPSAITDPDARFQYLTTAVLPTLTRLPKPVNGGQGILIFVPSHADFSRLRNYFATSNDTMNISFGAISEFSETSEVRRARSHFASGRHSMLLYSGRAHHFRRYRIKGVRKVVMYGLPDNPIFYQEIVGGFLSSSALDGKVTSEEAAVRVMFSKWDVLALERVVGTKRVGSMVKETGGGDTFDFI